METQNETDYDLTNFSRREFTTVAVFLGIIGVFGTINNLLVIIVWIKNKSLRTPFSIYLLNLNLGDFFVSVLATPMTFAANVVGRWQYGATLCSVYAFMNSAAGVSSILTLAYLSIERYSVIRSPLTSMKITHQRAAMHTGLTWILTLVITTPPFFGWGRYTPEGPGTSCSVNWESGKPRDVSYIVFLFITALFIPLTVMVVCYSNLVYVVYKSRKNIAPQFPNAATNAKKERKVALMIVLMVMSFVICWSPYAVLSLYVAFGNAENVTTTIAFIPSIVAKSSTVYNPIIYFALNKQYRQALIAMLRCGKQPTKVSPHGGNNRFTSGISTINESYTQRSGLNLNNIAGRNAKRKLSTTQKTPSKRPCKTNRKIQGTANKVVPAVAVEFVR